MKLFRLVLIVSEVFLFLLFLSPPFVGGHPLARAIVAYHQDPSVQNKSELELQRELHQHRRFVQSLLIGSLLAVNTVGLFYVSRLLRRRCLA